MTKYNKAIITKSDNDGCEIQFHTTEKKEILNCDDYQFLEKQMFFLKKREIEVNELKNIVLVLSENKIKSLNDKIRNVSSRDKKLLSIYSYVLFLPKIPLEAIETKNVFVDKEQKNAINISTFYNQNPETIIPAEPTEKQLDVITKNSVFNLTSRKWQNLEEWNKEYNSYITNNMPFKDSKEIPVITQEQAKEIYYKLHELNINYSTKERYKNEYLDNLTNEELDEHYKTQLNLLEEELKTIQQYRKVIKHILYENQTSKRLATPNDLRIATMGTKQDLKWGDIDNKHQDKVKELLKSTAPEILNKLEDEENPNEIISKFIGTKLAKKELRILKTLRALVDQAFNLEEIQDYSHKTRIYTANFYKEYGLKSRKEGGYEDNQTRSIREILFNSNSNLTKRTFFYNKKNQKVMVTAFVLKLDWETDNNYFEVMLDEIIFVKDKSDEYSYYYENLQALNRLMELMPNSDSAFELHEYLEYSIKTTNHEFGLTKLLRASPTLAKRYAKDRNGTIQRLEKVLDGMVQVKALISAWQKVNGKNEIKYILTNLYKKEK